MQPSLILPIILKDLRANRWLFAAFFAASVLSTASSFLNPQNLGPLARYEFLKMSISLAAAVLFSLIYLLIMARVVHADPPASDTAFLATRPVSGTTLFFAKLLLIMVSLFLIPSAIEAVAKLLLGFETSVVLESSFGPRNWMTMMSIFALCSMTKKLRWFLVWNVVFFFGMGVFLIIGVIGFTVFPFLMNPNWAELAGMYSFLVDRQSFENTTMLLPFVAGPIALFGIIWRQYVRPNTLRSAVLFVGATLITCLLVFVGYRQALHLPPEAKAASTSLPTGALAPKPTNLYLSETKITSGKGEQQVNPTPSMRGSFSFSNWPEDIYSMAVSNVSVSFSRDGQPVTIPILPENSGLSTLAKILRVAKSANQPTEHDGYYSAIFLDIPSQKENPIHFSWPPPGLKNGLPPDTGGLTLRMDLAVFQYKTQAILPLQVGETARFGNRIATVRSINPSTSLRNRNVTLEIDEMSASSSQADPVYRLKTGDGLVKASKSERSRSLNGSGAVERATVSLTFPMPSIMSPESMSQIMAESLRDAELVVSNIAPAGTIQREIPINGVAGTETQYRARAVLFIDQDVDRFAPQLGGPEGQKRPIDMKTVIDLLRSSPFAQRVVARLKLDQDPQFLSAAGISAKDATPERVAVLLSGMSSALYRPNTGLIDVLITTVDSHLSVKIANAYCDEYIKYENDRQSSPAESAQQFLVEEADRLRKKMRVSEEAMQRIRERERVASMENMMASARSKVSEIANNQTEIVKRISQIDSDLAVVKANKGPVEDLLALPSVASEPKVAQYSEALSDRQRDLTILSEKYDSKNPQYAAIKEQIELTKAVLKRVLNDAVNLLEAARQRNEIQLVQIKSARERAEAELLNILEKSIEYNDIKRVQETDEALYGSVLTRLKGIEINKQLKESPVRIHEPAVEATPIRP